MNQICQNRPHHLTFFRVCLVLLLAHQPGAWARYVRRPTSGGTTSYGTGSVSLAFRQRQNNDNEGDIEAKPTVTNEESAVANEESFFAGEGAAGDDELDQDAFFDDETEFPTGIIPTTSPAPTTLPSMFPTLEESTAPTIQPTYEFEPTAEPTKEKDREEFEEAKDATEGPTSSPTVAVLTGTPTKTPAVVPTATLEETSLPLTSAPTNGDITVLSAPNVTEAEPVSVSSTTESPTSVPVVVVGNNFTFTNGTNATFAFDDDAAHLEGEDDDGQETMVDVDQDVTFFPTSSPTQSPTSSAPLTNSALPEFPVSGQLSLQLEGIAVSFPGDTRLIFLATVDEFVASAAKGSVEDIRVTVIYQTVVNDRRRKLQLSSEGDVALQVDLGVEGMAYDELLSAKDWNKWLYDLFALGGYEFVDMVQDLAIAEGNTFFEPLTSVRALEPATAIMNTVVPTDRITSPPVVVGNTQNNSNGGEGEDDGLPLGIIIGAAVGGFVFIIVGILLIRYVMAQGRKKTASPRGTNSIAENFGPSPDDDVPLNNKNSKKKNNSRTIQNKPSAGDSSVSSASYLTNNVNHHTNFNGSAGFNTSPQQLSSAPSESDNQSQMGATTMGDQSVMSYAYSLEPGIEPSVAGVPQSVAGPSSGASAMSYSVYPAGSSVASMTSGTSSFAFMKLPVNNKSGSTQGGSGINGRPTKDVIAPPGKLGIVIDTTLDGPVVHKVNPGSALEGKIFSGDIIVAIDNVDTRAMTAASITALMVQTANQRRKLSVVSQ